ncbi:MAG: hypothetical protein NW703_04585 [Nitrospiraceae bacterium]
MKRILMSMLAVAVLVAFSAPAFAGEKKEEKKGGHVTMLGEEKKDKGGKLFGEEKKDKGGKLFGEKKEEKKGK